MGMDRFFRSKSYIHTCRAYVIKAEIGIEMKFKKSLKLKTVQIFKKSSFLYDEFKDILPCASKVFVICFAQAHASIAFLA